MKYINGLNSESEHKKSRHVDIYRKLNLGQYFSKRGCLMEAENER